MAAKPAAPVHSDLRGGLRSGGISARKPPKTRDSLFFPGRRGWRSRDRSTLPTNSRRTTRAVVLGALRRDEPPDSEGGDHRLYGIAEGDAVVVAAGEEQGYRL